MLRRVVRIKAELILWISVLVLSGFSDLALAQNFNANLQVPATNSTGSYTVTWNSGTSESLQESFNGSSYSNVYTGTAGTKSFSGKSAGSYIYRVYRRQCIFVCIDLYSETATVVVDLTPSVPGAISFSSLSHASSGGDNNAAFTVSWGAATGNITAYQLQQRINGGAWTTIHNASGTSKSRSGLANGTYQYRVKACNGSTCSGYGTTKTVYVAITPGVPASISVSPHPSTNGNHTISWGASSGSITKYDLNRKIGSGSWTNLYDGTALSRAYSGLSNGSYAYQVRACKTTASYTSCSGYRTSSTATVTLPPGTTGAISFSSLSSSGSSGDNNGVFTVSWGAASGTVTAYQLQQRLNGGSWSTIHNATSVSKSRSGLSNGTYDYRVRACNGTACSSYSAIKTVYVALIPGIPASISVSPNPSTNGSHTISWTASTGSVTKYDLNRSVNGGSWTTSYDGTGLSKVYTGQGNGNYEYQVRACKTTGGYTTCSGYRTSSVATVVDPVAPGAINFSSLSHSGSSGDNNGAFTVSWGTASGTITAYQLQQRLNGGSWSTIHNAADTSAARSGLADGTYDYQVRACNGSSCSNYGTIRSVYVAITPSVPGTISAPGTDNDGSFTVSWGASTGNVDYYQLDQQANGSNWAIIYSGSNLTTTVNGLVESSYTYRAKACNTQATYTSCSNYQTSATTIVLYNDADGDGISDKIDAFPFDGNRTVAEFDATSDGTDFSFSMMLKLVCECAVGSTMEYKINSGVWLLYKKPLVFDETTTVSTRIHSQGSYGSEQIRIYTRTLSAN